MLLKKTIVRQFTRKQFATRCSSKNEKQNKTPVIIPKTINQKTYVKHLKDDNVSIVVASGSAGTGKSMIATCIALEHLLDKRVEKLIITRPTVSAGGNFGALPGTLADKMNPYMLPIYHHFYKYTSKSNIDTYLKNGQIEICPLEFTRGRSFEGAYIVADEVQNCTFSQMKMLLTRIGDGSKMVLTGDTEQTDLRGMNGLEDFVMRYHMCSDIETKNKIKLVELNDSDVVRSDIVRRVLSMYHDT